MRHFSEAERRDILFFPERLAPSNAVGVLPASCHRLAVIGNYPPTRCGIATFTADMIAALRSAEPRLEIDIYRMDCSDADTDRDRIISSESVTHYRAAAARIEASVPDAVWVQHEFGLFGGEAGEWIIDLLEPLSAPLIVTLHTILDEPTPAQRRVTEWLAQRASKLVVMSHEGAATLERVYGVDPGQIAMIPHGVPDRPFGRGGQMKARYGLSGKRMLMTFGLLSPGKGLETVIAALPSIVSEFPDTVYCIAGATHPKLVAQQGEAYRHSLIEQAQALGVADHIRWVDRFLETDELLDLIEAADIYLTPYKGAGQSTSGTLAYAVALGKAVISTPYKHANELLADGNGILVPFGDVAALATAVSELFADEEALEAMQRRAYSTCRSMIWPVFGERSLDVLREVAVARAHCVEGVMPRSDAGLLRLCDDTGMLQHSVLSIPDRNHGYCVDDNARALMLANTMGGRFGKLAPVFAAFLEHSWNPDSRRFRNFMSFDRRWLEPVGSEDSCGRVLWALGATMADGRTREMREWARWLYRRSSAMALEFQSPRALAFAMLGADRALEGDGQPEIAKSVLANGAARLLDGLRHYRRDDWYWFEAGLAYDNCRLPQALLRAGIVLGDETAIVEALTTLEWLLQKQTAPAGHHRPIGSAGFCEIGKPPLPFDQQPVDAWATVDAAVAAYRYDRDPHWLDAAKTAYAWFFGSNDRGAMVADVASGSCFDGITPRGVNLNQGAESVLALHLAGFSLRSVKEGEWGTNDFANSNLAERVPA